MIALLAALAGPSALAQSPPTDLRSAEAAWWSMLGETVPGRPGAVEALGRWLALYQYTPSPRVPAVQALLYAHQYQDQRAQLRAFELARLPLQELERKRTQRQIARLAPRDHHGRIELDWAELGYVQATFVPASLAFDGDPLEFGIGGTAHLGMAAELFDLEGILLAGVALDKPMLPQRLDPVVRGELAAAVGGDGLLLFAGAGLSNQLGLHQFGQIQLTNDGDGLWAVLALRLQAEEHFLEETSFGLRALAQVGFKFGGTPD